MSYPYKKIMQSQEEKKSYDLHDPAGGKMVALS